MTKPAAATAMSAMAMWKAIRPRVSMLCALLPRQVIATCRRAKSRQPKVPC